MGLRCLVGACLTISTLLGPVIELRLSTPTQYDSSRSPFLATATKNAKQREQKNGNLVVELAQRRGVILHRRFRGNEEMRYNQTPPLRSHRNECVEHVFQRRQLGDEPLHHLAETIENAVICNTRTHGVHQVGQGGRVDVTRYLF